MSKYYWVCADGIDNYEEYEYELSENIHSKKEMIEAVKYNLKCLGGGHADIFDEETNELFAEIEV